MSVAAFPSLLPRRLQTDVLAALRTIEKVSADTPFANMNAAVLHIRRSPESICRLVTLQTILVHIEKHSSIENQMLVS
jgi:hypothetical protein